MADLNKMPQLTEKIAKKSGEKRGPALQLVPMFYKKRQHFHHFFSFTF